MKKKAKIINILLILLILMFNCFNMVKVYATQSTVPDVNYYKPTEESVPTEVTNVASTIVSILQVVGTVIAVITLMFLGIKYMAGSAQYRAEYKKSMIPYLIGCVMLFAIVTIISAVYNLILPLTNNI